MWILSEKIQFEFRFFLQKEIKLLNKSTYRIAFFIGLNRSVCTWGRIYNYTPDIFNVADWADKNVFRKCKMFYIYSLVYLVVWGQFSHHSQGERVERVAERETATAAPYCLSWGLLGSLESAVKACFGFARLTRVTLAESTKSPDHLW